MVRRSMRSNAMVRILYGESVCCGYDHVIRKSGVNRSQELLLLRFVARTGISDATGEKYIYWMSYL